MAMKKQSEKGKENVAAALDQLDAASNTVSKAAVAVRRRIEELDELVNDLESRLNEVEKERSREIQSLKDQFLRENTALSTRLQGCEEKLKKVQQTLS